MRRTYLAKVQSLKNQETIPFCCLASPFDVFIWSPLMRRHLFQPLSLVCISVIIHYTLLNVYSREFRYLLVGETKVLVSGKMALIPSNNGIV